jgi:putative membrane protein
MASKNDDESKLAEDRTKWAEDRTLLANERTFSSWMGAGLGCLGLAVGLQAVFGAVEPTWIAKTAASIFVIIAIYVFQNALLNSRRAKKRLESHVSEPVSDSNLAWIAHLLSAGSLVVGLVLWII